MSDESTQYWRRAVGALAGILPAFAARDEAGYVLAAVRAGTNASARPLWGATFGCSAEQRAAMLGAIAAIDLGGRPAVGLGDEDTLRRIGSALVSVGLKGDAFVLIATDAPGQLVVAADARGCAPGEWEMFMKHLDMMRRDIRQYSDGADRSRKAAPRG